MLRSRFAGELGKSLLGVLLDASAHEFAEGKKVGIGDGVAGEISIFFLRDEACIEQEAEVFGDVALLHAGGVDEFGDGHGFAHERAQKLEPGGLGEDGKESRCLLDLCVGHGRFLFCLHIAN